MVESGSTDWMKQGGLMSSLNGAIIICGFLMFLCLGTMITVAGGTSANIGCFVIGSEINSDNSVEYLALGNC